MNQMILLRQNACSLKTIKYTIKALSKKELVYISYLPNVGRQTKIIETGQVK